MVSPEPMVYMFSDSDTWQCQAWVPSHGVGLKSNQIVVGYASAFMQFLHQYVMVTIVERRDQSWVGVYLSLLALCRVISI